MPELQINRNRPPFFALRVVLRTSTGETFSRDYVRGDWHIGKDKFTAYAIGDLILYAETATVRDLHVEEIDFETVVENRRYHHTTD